MSSDAWELSKENIQPLKGGRKAAMLAQNGQAVTSLAPSAERQKEIREARRSGRQSSQPPNSAKNVARIQNPSLFFL